MSGRFISIASAVQKAFGGLILAAALAACGSTSLLEPQKVEYKSATKLPSLEVPPDLTTPTRDDRYAVPDVTPRGSATYSAYSAERSGQARASTAQEVLPRPEKFRIERSGSQRWLVAEGSPERLWPLVREFWLEMGFIINIEVPEAGILETDWAENRAKIPQDGLRNVLGKFMDQVYSTPERDKFRTRLEAGTQPGTTEIYISHRGMIEIYVTEAREETKWQPRPADPELEAEMLSRLMVRLGAEETKARTLVASTAAGQERARMRRDAGGPASLEVMESFDRAWRRVGLALDRVGFTVEDRNRTEGLYFVRYVDPEADAKSKKSDGGLLSKLMFWRGDDKPAQGGSQYRVRVAPAGEQSTVAILTREGQPDRSESAGRILSLLYDQLK